MEIGTIGAGAFAQAFAKQALKAGHKVKLSNRRGPDSLREIVDRLGPGAMAATRENAAACEMVLLAVPWDNVPETLAGLPKWKNVVKPADFHEFVNAVKELGIFWAVINEPPPGSVRKK